ncbi:hypothetical protein AB9N12_07990 [Bacteroides sp. AN502(2024)]|uniref:hypothetical protein n=1 Tax=Bacteroides sp. AN502(2024) TaxID=3160599 RepID=UPI0035162EFF
MIDKIIYVYLFRLFYRARYPDRAGFMGAILPKLVLLYSIMYIFTGADGYVHFDNTLEKTVCCGAIAAWALNGIYILHFSSGRNYNRTEKEVRQAMSQHPLRWKVVISIYLAATTAFAVWVFRH